MSNILLENGGKLLLEGSGALQLEGNSAAPIDHVIIVMEENSDYAGIIGNSAMPYFNSLVNSYVLESSYYGDTHPSIGNYFMLTSGQIITNDDNFTGTVSDDNIVRKLIAAGKTWKEYSENLPSVGYTGGDVGLYAKRHNPLSFFSDVTGAQLNNLVPFTHFAPDLANNVLPNYSFVVPNLDNDMHDGTAAMADSWLSANIGPLISSSLNYLLIIVWDESETDNTNGGGHIVCTLIGPAVKNGYVSTTTYQHESVLRLACDVLGIPAPGAAATAPSMLEEAFA